MGRSTIPLAIIIGGIIVALTLYLSAPKKPVGDPSLVRPVSAADHILGNPTAKVVIIAYSDFECPFCKSFHDTLHQIVANEGASGEVAWVLRHFPLTELHDSALPLARASECAAEVAGNEGFWRFADLLFKNQPVDPARLGEIAAAANIPTTAFATCYASASESVLWRIARTRSPLAQTVRRIPSSLRADEVSSSWTTPTPTIW